MDMFFGTKMHNENEVEEVDEAPAEPLKNIINMDSLTEKEKEIHAKKQEAWDKHQDHIDRLKEKYGNK